MRQNAGQTGRTCFILDYPDRSSFEDESPLLLLVVLFITPCFAAAETTRLPADFPTIQAAIDLASAGVYRELLPHRARLLPR